MTQEAAVPPGLMEQIRQIAQEEVAKAYRSAPLRSSSISGGDGLTVGPGSKFTVQHPTGGQLLLAGIYDVNHNHDLADGSYQPMMLLRRADGTLALSMYDPSPTSGGYQQFLAVWDRDQNVIFSDDTASGQGLARPNLSGGFAATQFADFQCTTASASFVTLADQWVTKQQPRLEIYVRSSMDTSGATGEMRVLVNGVQLGATTAETFTVKSATFLGAVAGAHMELVRVEIQGRVTGGSGQLRVEPVYWRGRQT